jgi:hypothetical protein
MPRTLRVNVQVDRLPDVNNAAGDPLCQIGIRLSAAVMPDPTDVTPSPDANLLLPWMWRSKVGDQNGSWVAHEKRNWKLWRLKNDGSNPEEVDAAHWEMAVADPKKFDVEVDNTDPETSAALPKVRPFHHRIAKEVSAIVADIGPRALEVPGAGNVVSGRTVFGLTESLTALPHPLPVGMQVWTAISLKATAFPAADTDRFLAAPAFATAAGVAYTVDMGHLAGPPATSKAWEVPYQANPGGVSLEVGASVHASLPMATLKIPNDDPQRLIDLSTLLVRQSDAPAFEGSDWSTGLPLRIAEAIDPAARAMAVLDNVIRTRVEAEGSNSPTREALRVDILPRGAPPDYLRGMLEALHRPILAPRARASRPTAAPAAALLERMALGNPTLWPAVVPLLFAHASAENDAPKQADSVVPPLPPHVVITRARIADAAGILPARNDELQDLPKTPDSQPIATLDNEQAFRDWLLRHWTSVPDAALTPDGKTYDFRGTTRRLFLKANKVEPPEIKRTGVLDLMRIPRAAQAIEVNIPLALANAQLPNVVTFVLRAPDAPAQLELRLNLDTGKTELLVNGADPVAENKPFTGGRLTIEINVADAMSVKLTYSDNAGWKLSLDKLSTGDPIDITAVAQAGRVGLSVSATDKIVVAIDSGSVPTGSLQGGNGSTGQGQALRGALALAYAGPALAGLMGGWVPLENETADSAVAKLSLRERLIKTIGAYVPKTFDAAFAQARTAPVPQADAAVKEAQQRVQDAQERRNNASPADKPMAEREVKRCEQELSQAKHRLDLVSKGRNDLAPLIDDLLEAAKLDAQRLAKELVPPKNDRGADTLTPDAPPLTFVIDQLQDFDETVDLWTRLAGLGVLIGRQGGPKDSQDEWWSLNVATLHVSRRDRDDSKTRAPLDKGNAVPVEDFGDWPNDWLASSRVDPVPLAVSEVTGVRSAVIRYDSQSIVAEMDRRPQLDPRGQARTVTRRPEAYLFPIPKRSETKQFAKLPPLTFGRQYDVVPYLTGHGGVLPPALRQKAEEPVGRLPPALDNVGKPKQNGELKIARAEIGNGIIRSKVYLRTVPVGAPRLSAQSVWPGLIEDIAPLAAELPIRAAPITLRQQLPARFFLDKEQTRGMLNSPPDITDAAGTPTEPAGIRIEIDGIDVASPSGKLIVTAQAFNLALGTADRLRIEVTRSELAAAATTGTAGLRIDVVGSDVKTFALKSRAAQFAEDWPDALPFTPATAPVINKPVSEWQSFALVLQADAADFDVEPPSIRWGALRPTTTEGTPRPPTFQLDGDRPIFPPEFVPQSRDVTLLDGIGNQRRRSGPQTAIIKLRRPSASLATYDRWVNGPLSGYGSANSAVIAEALNKAAARATGTMQPGVDRSLDDPAVEALVLEVVQLFPQRRVDQAPVLLKAISGAAAILGNGSDLVSLDIKLDDDHAPLGSAKLDIAAKPTLTLARGCVYELRLYGAMPLAQPLFAPENNPKKVATRERFAPAAAAGWRDVELGGTRWHLGAPLILTVEVASELMPEFYVEKADPANDSPAHMAFSMDLLRPPRVTRERATVHLQPDCLGAPRPPVRGDDALVRYAALRHVDRIALFEQRWSWRGRPHAEIPAVTIEQFGQKGYIDQAARHFVDTAFIGRSDDDIGTIHEMRITRAHAYGGRANFPVPRVDPPLLEHPPVVLERELDYRGGANLWRFALRAKSRYAALRPNDPLLIRFTHRRDDKANTLWWPFVVPDRANPLGENREVRRPGLMLVVPLTEPLMTAGSVPPLLALFNEAMFPLFHAGDGIQSVIEVARHPFIGMQRVGKNSDTGQDFPDEFRKAWNKVAEARHDMAEAERVLATLGTFDADPRPGELAAAEAAAKAARDASAAAELDYAKIHAIGVAWGYVDHLKTVLDQVTATRINAEKELDDETHKPAPDAATIQRLTLEITRLKAREKQLAGDGTVNLPGEINIAKQEAEKVQSDKPIAGDALRTGSPLVKYWPEYAPDPIRTGEGASGEPLALRCDGPVGYTFDIETEAGRFDHAGILVSPVAANVRPWSLVKLRFRRLEAPELLVDREGKAIAPTVPLPTAVDSFKEFRLSSCDPAPSEFPHTIHEGLAFDIDDLQAHGPMSLRLSFDQPETNADGEAFILVEAKTDLADPLRPRLMIDASTNLGRAEQWAVSFETGSVVQMRVVVSQRPKPDGDQDYRPSGDVSVHARVVRATATDALQRPHENAWLSAICMPVNARDAIAHDAAVMLRVRADKAPTTVVVRPVRLSDFTPGVWCQFAAAMSRVVVDAEIKTPVGSRGVRELLPVARLTATKVSGGKTLSLGLSGVRRGEAVSKIAFTAEARPDDDSQVEERLYALVTRYVYDAFDRLRERPIAVHKLPDHLSVPVLGESTWPEGELGTPYASGGGRVRIVRVLRGRSPDDGGFESRLKEFPRDFFGNDVETVPTEEPLDAAGQVIGISAPFEWSS